MGRLASSGGLVGVWVACVGLLVGASAAVANPRIDCEDTPRLEKAGPDGVEISTDKVGLVRVTAEGDDDKDDVLNPDEFCRAHEGVDVFILPAPRIIDVPAEPDNPEGLSPDREMAPGSSGKVVDDSEDDEDEADDEEGEGTPSIALTGAGNYKNLPIEAAGEGGCSQAPADSDGGLWLLGLPIVLFGLRRRRGGR